MKRTATVRRTNREVYGGLSPRQRRAAIALMTSTSKRQAAKAANVGIRSLNRWQKDPVFRKEIETIHNAAIEAAVESLQKLMPTAIGRLEEIIQWKVDPKRPGLGHVILRAIEIILDRGRTS